MHVNVATYCSVRLFRESPSMGIKSITFVKLNWGATAAPLLHLQAASCHHQLGMKARSAEGEVVVNRKSNHPGQDHKSSAEIQAARGKQ